MKHTPNIPLLLISTVLLAFNSFAQIEQADSTVTKKTIASADTLRKPLVPLRNVGLIERSPTYLIADSSINFLDYTYAGDLLQTVPGVFTFDLGSPGQLHGITINGLDARNIAFMSDGVLLNEPFTGVFDPFLYPTENIEHVEIITGPRAFLYGLNSTGMAVNFVSKSKSAIHPYSRIRYQEAPYGHAFVDGMFSQDIIRGLNMTAGASHYTYGGRFTNSDYDAWNARIKFRYNISNKLNVFASGMYNRTQLGLNGGIDLNKTPDSVRYDRLQATLVNTDSYEKASRYDLQAGAAATFFDDTTALTTLTLFHSTNFREYRDEENRPKPNGIYIKEDMRSQWYGAKLTQHLMLGNNPIDLGAEIESRGVIASDTIGNDVRTLKSIFGKVEFPFTNQFTLSYFGRFSSYFGDGGDQSSTLSTGADLAVKPGSFVEARVGYSYSTRFPTLEDFHFSGPEITTLENHHLFETSISLANSHFFINTKFFYQRFFNNSIFFTDHDFRLLNLYSIESSGLDVSVFLRLASFVTESYIVYYHRGEERFLEIRQPEWSGHSGIYFWDKLFNNRLDLKAGVRLNAFTSYQAMNYNSRYQVYTESSNPEIPGAAVLDFLFIARIGDAYIHFIIENLLDKQYVMTSFYPMNERNLRFGISWDFLD